MNKFASSSSNLSSYKLMKEKKMNVQSFYLPVLLILADITTIPALEAKACSSKQLPVCVISRGVKQRPKDFCVNINEIENFKNGQDAQDLFYGECSDYDNSKINTFACNAGLRFIGDLSVNDSKANYVNYSIADADNVNDENFVRKTMNASNNQVFNEVSSEIGTQKIQDGSSLQFNFGAESYGADYFVDLCILNDNLNPERYNFTLSGNVLFTQSIFSAQNYNNSSLLLNKTDLICLDENGNQSLQNLVAESRFISSERRFSKSVTLNSLCYVRHTFKESAKLSKRENNYKKVTFQTTLNLENQDDELNGSSTVVDLCKIKKQSSNSYTCTAWSIQSNGPKNTLLDDIIKSGFIDKDVYAGACPIPCNI